MSSIFHFRSFVFSIFFLTSVSMIAQGKSDKSKSEASLKNHDEKLGFGAIEYVQPITTGDNFFGLAMEGKSGFNIKGQLFVYKHIFVAGTMGTSYFNVIDQSLVGNYFKTRVNHQYISIGYELLPVRNIRMGASFSAFGNLDYENESRTNTSEAFQTDEGKIRSFEVYLDYMINNEFAIYLKYNYRNDKMDIQTAPEIQSLFNNASFHNIGFGIKLYFGQETVLPGIIN